MKKQAEEEQKSIYEKEIAAQLPESYHTLRNEMPLDPHWGVKKNSEGKNTFWYGYKGHLAVGTQSQYILGALLSSGNLNDGKAAVPLLKGIAHQHPSFAFQYATAETGYDFEPIYKQIRKAGAHAIIAYNRRRDPEMIGFEMTRFECLLKRIFSTKQCTTPIGKEVESSFKFNYFGVQQHEVGC